MIQFQQTLTTAIARLAPILGPTKTIGIGTTVNKQILDIDYFPSADQIVPVIDQFDVKVNSQFDSWFQVLITHYFIEIDIITVIYWCLVLFSYENQDLDEDDRKYEESEDCVQNEVDKAQLF